VAAVVVVSAGSCCCRRPRRTRASAASEPAEGRVPRQAGQAVNLGELRKQKLQVQEYVTQLEKQLPGKAEMDALLSDINQAGLGRGLQFELFRPGQVEVKDYYAELPISLRVTGATTTSAPSRPTWPTCRASSRCTTWPSPAVGTKDTTARCRWKPRRAPTATSTPSEVAEQKKAAEAAKAGSQEMKPRS
jgi:type IV pilus assembly protein PilO